MLPTCTIDRNSATFTDSRGWTYWFSYKTCIGFESPDGKRMVRENEWGPTTGKHLNAIDGGDKNAKASRVTGAEFVKALEFYTA